MAIRIYSKMDNLDAITDNEAAAKYHNIPHTQLRIGSPSALSIEREGYATLIQLEEYAIAGGLRLAAAFGGVGGPADNGPLIRKLVHINELSRACPFATACIGQKPNHLGVFGLEPEDSLTERELALSDAPAAATGAIQDIWWVRPSALDIAIKRKLWPPDGKRPGGLASDPLPQYVLQKNIPPPPTHGQHRLLSELKFTINNIAPSANNITNNERGKKRRPKNDNTLLLEMNTYCVLAQARQACDPDYAEPRPMDALEEQDTIISRLGRLARLHIHGLNSQKIDFHNPLYRKPDDLTVLENEVDRKQHEDDLAEERARRARKQERAQARRQASLEDDPEGEVDEAMEGGLEGPPQGGRGRGRVRRRRGDEDGHD